MYKNKCASFNGVMWLMTGKVKLKMKNKSLKYDINRPMLRHVHK